MFKNAEESQAWSTFFAAQCPRIINAQAKTVAKELEVAATAADAMLEEWRKRQPAIDAPTTDEKKEEEASPTAPPKRGRKAKAQKEEPAALSSDAPEPTAAPADVPAQEEAPAKDAEQEATS